nr:zinc finger, CCHC-type [Tanacetum cinerariifolium]
MPKDRGENPTVEQVRKRAKWDNDNFLCRGLILNGMSDSLFDIYQNVDTSKELCDTLKPKYMVEDASSKKFLVSNFMNYKITDSRPVLEQYNEIIRILGRFTQHKMNMDESIHVSCIIDKIPPSWKDFKHTLKHLKEELTLVELGSHLRIEESLKAQENDKPKGNNVVGPLVVNMVEHNNSSSVGNLNTWKKDCKDGNVGNKANGSSTKGSEDGSSNPLKAFMSTSKLNDSILWHARLGHVHFKRMQDMSKDGLIPTINMDTKKCKTCMLTKITKKPFQNVKRKAKVLELIHNDLCDLRATHSLGNKKYIVTFIDDASRAFVRLFDPKLKTLGERGIECIFVGYAEQSKDFRFYVIEPNDLVAINSIVESRDAIFDENMFSSVPRLRKRSLVKGTEDSGSSVVSKRVTDEIVQQSKPQLRNSKRQRTLKDFGPEFQLYLIEGTKDLIFDQHFYFFNVKDDPKIFDEAMKPLGCKWIFKRKMKVDGTVEKFKARLVIQGFNQKSRIYYFDTYALVARISNIRLLIAMVSIYNLIIHQMDVKKAFLNRDIEEEEPKQWHQKFNEGVLSDGYLLNQADKCMYSKFDASGKGVIILLYVDEMLIFGTDQVQVNLTKEFLLSRFSIKDMWEADIILVSTPLDTCEKLMPNRGLVVSQLKYSRVIGCLMYAMTCTRPNIAFAVRKLSSNTEDNSSTSGWEFLLGGGTISLAFKKQTCITRSTIEYEFVALAAAAKEAEWLKNLLLEIPLWVKPMALISIRCDSAATLAKAYSQMYNGKSIHLVVRHSMIRELITNGVVSKKFVRSQQNLADHLTKGLSRDLVIKSAEGM